MAMWDVGCGMVEFHVCVHFHVNSDDHGDDHGGGGTAMSSSSSLSSAMMIHGTTINIVQGVVTLARHAIIPSPYRTAST